jgi:hypothetical protein
VKPIAGALLVLVFAGCNPQAPRPSATTSPSAQTRGPWLHVTQRGTARRPLHIWLQAGNRKQYDLTASSYESSGVPGRTVGTFFVAHVTFVARTGQRLFARAPQAIVDEVSNTLTLSGGVHARTDTGMTLSCDNLRYDPKTEMLHGVGRVVIGGAHGVRATGSVVDSDVALSRAVLQ